MSLYGPVLDKGLLEQLESVWGRIGKAAARSIKRKAKGFLPDLEDEDQVLGCGAWGCVWKTRDKRFVLKCSLDATEGPTVAHVMSSRKLRLHPGVAYYRSLWQLPELVWVDELGFTPIWVALREEAACHRCWTADGEPPKRLEKVHDILEAVPEFGDDLTAALCEEDEEPDEDDNVEQRKHYEGLFMDLLGDLKRTPAKYIGQFMAEAYKLKDLVLGDVHYGNIGFRRHDLSEFKVPRHKLLIAIDIGDQAQPVSGEDTYPHVKKINPPPRCPKNPEYLRYWQDRIPVLP
jgi:hypothetical protein